MLILSENSLTISFLNLLLLCTTGNGFTYSEPPDDPVELSRRGQVEATSCGSGSGTSCSSNSSCRSGRTETPTADYVLKDILSNCTEGGIQNSLPSSAIEANGYVRITSSNKEDCKNINKSVGMTENPGVAFWIYNLGSRNCNLFQVGSVQVKISSTSAIAISDNYNQATANLVQSNEWIHVYIRSESPTNSSIFINGDYYPAVSSTGLPRNPSRVTLNIGCELSMVDFRFYKNYLSNREIQKEIYEGFNLSDTPISFPECRCRQSNPVLVMNDEDPSGVFCQTLEESVSPISRLANKMVDSVRDGNSSTFWEGSDGSQTISFMFDQVFMIDRVTLNFSPGSRSESVGIVLLVNNREKNANLQSVTSDSVTWGVRKNPPSENSTRSEVEEMIANTIKIELNSSSNVKVREISIIGRCYCNGNSESAPESCNITGRNFKCTCQDNREVTGDSCEQCKSNVYREEEEFACSKICGCSTKGTEQGKQQECEQVGGQCTCKRNVEGRVCDTCKHLHYNLTASNSNGCSQCNCGPGTKECDKVMGRCTCKQNVEATSGRCEKCNFGHYGVSLDQGCRPCNCHIEGVIGDPRNCTDSQGQCNCKGKVKGLKCNECMDKYFNLTRDNSEGCKPCRCNRVGSVSEICEKNPAGMCRCRGNASMINSRSCDPVFEPFGLEPDFGPISGNTTVTVKGRLFGSGSIVTPEVAVGNSLFKSLVSFSDESLTFITPSHDTAQKVDVTLRWKKVYEVGPEVDFIKMFKFEYRLNPLVNPDLVQSIEAFKMGGCKIPIRGTNLNSVSQPRLIVYNESGIKLKTEQCSVSSSTEILCNSPRGFSKDTILRFGIQLDGTTMYEDYNTFPNKQIKIVKDPVPTKETDDKQEYKPVFDVELQIEGQEFTSGCADSDFVVELKGASNSYPCLITSRGRNLIKCEPDIGFPGVDEEVMMMLYIGGHEFDIQRVKLHKFWSTWQFILIAVGGSVFILLVTLLPIILCCLCRNKKVQTINRENGLLTNDQSDVNPLNTNDISLELDTQNHPRARPNSYEGVQLEKECWENFIHKINQSVRKMLNASHMEKADIVVGTRCIKKGTEIRIIDGSFANGTGKPYAGKPAMMKTLVNSYSNFENDLLPEWVNTGLQECLRFRDAFDENILQTKGIATDKDRFFITYPGYKRSLKDYLSDKNTTPTKGLLLDICVQILEGVQFLHNIDIVHKDLAARNCVVSNDDRVQVTDAAFSWNLYPEEYMYDSRREKYLPVRWMAPESLTAGFYDKASDVWSFGVLVWEVTSLCLYLPYTDVTKDADIQNHVTTGYRLGKPENASDALYEGVMLPCWEKQSSHRLKVSEIGDKFDQILNPDSSNDPSIYYNNTSELETDNIYTNEAFQ